MSWISDLSANRFNNTYFRDAHGTGFAVDMSGDLIVRNGNVGIGTDSPDNILTIEGGVLQLNPFVTGTKKFLLYSDDDVLRISPTPTTNLYTSTPGLTMNSSGYVGIGVEDPSRTFHLNGHQFLHETGNGDAYWYGNSDNKYVLMWGGYFKMYIHSDNDLALDNFTGQHRTFVENILHTDASNNAGLIVCANKNTYISMSNELQKGNQAITQNESLPVVSLSTKSKDKSCFGVISESEDPDMRGDRVASVFFPTEKQEGDTRIFINSVGEGAIWVSNKNGPLESGDYITTSDIPGYGEKQEDDILHNYTVAKITMDCDFNPQLQPKEIILKEAAVDDSGNTVYNNVLDANGEIQWTPELDSDGNVVQEYPYNLRYLDLQGARLTKAEYDTKLANGEQVHIAAYVGCTYHCG